MIFFACLDVLCLRETVFWITGMMNYLLPAVMFLLGYYLFQLVRAEKIAPWKQVAYCIVAFLTACSVEQYALMFVGIMTLHHGWDLVRKKRIPVIQWASYGLSLIGLACLILAPGNFDRVDEQQIPSFVSNVWSLLYQDTMHDVALPFTLMLSVISMFVPCKHKVLTQISTGITLLLMLSLCTPLANKALFLAVLMLLWIAQMLLLFVCSTGKSRISLLFLMVIGLGSQIMLLISAIWGFRCMFSLYMVYMLLIGILLQKLEKNTRLVVLCVGILAAFHPALALVFFVLCGLRYAWKKHAVSQNVCKTIIRGCTAAALIVLCLGYGSNVPVYKENLASINEKQETVVIRQLPHEEYAWYWVPFGDFHTDYCKQYYGLDASTELVFELLEEAE